MLVYQSNHTTLVVKEYNDSTIFPAPLTVDEDVTMFLFGKNDALQSEPTLTLREGETHALYEPKTTDGKHRNMRTVKLKRISLFM